MGHSGGRVHYGAMARHDGGGHGYAGPRRGGPKFAEGGDRGRFVEHGDRGRFVEPHDRGDRRFAERDHDRNRDFDQCVRHRVFRNGVWVWVYGPAYAYHDYYA